MEVNLVIFTPNGSAKSIKLRPGRYVIGRKDTASLRIPSPQVSREHCELVLEEKTLTVRDLKSSNGTFKNQQKIQASALAAGDFLTIGPVVMGIQIDGKPAQIKPPAPEKPSAAAAMMETPPAGNPSPAQSDDPDRTVARAAPSNIKSNSSDDSSVFDFDFDFEDDEKPKR